MVVLETKRSDFYVQLFGADGGLADGPCAMEAVAIQAALPEGETPVAGDGADRLLAAMAPNVARLRRLRSSRFSVSSDVVPASVWAPTRSRASWIGRPDRVRSSAAR